MKKIVISAVIIVIAAGIVFIVLKRDEKDEHPAESIVAEYKTTIVHINPANDKPNGGRAANDLIIYSPEYGKTTQTPATGIEAVVKNGSVVSIGGNNSSIPKKGFVISGHGDAARWIANHLFPGVTVEYDDSLLSVTVTAGSLLKYAGILVKKADKRVQNKDLHKSIVYDSLQAYTSQYEKALKSTKEADDKATYKTKAQKTLDAAKKYYFNTFASYKAELRTCWYRLEEESPEELENTIKQLSEYGFNALCPETIYEGNTLYPDAHPSLTQNPKFEGWDPLKELERLCKKYDMQLIPWIEVYFIGFEGSPLITEKAEWLGKTKEGKIYSDMEKGYHFFCPSRPEVRRFWLGVYKTLLDRYEIDGFQLDYIRYPVSKPDEKGYCYCDYCRNRFKTLHQADPLKLTANENPELWEKWNQYRIEQIDTFVAQVSQMIKADYPHIRLSADVFPSIEHSLTVKSQNWSQWLKNGWIDDVYIMAYSDKAEPVFEDTKYMINQLNEGQNGYTGLGQFLGLTAEMLLLQIESAQKAKANGVSIFSWGYLKRNPQHLEAIKQGPFRNEAF